jgi:hypothetical protein
MKEPLKGTIPRDMGERLKAMETITLVTLSMGLIMETELCMIKMVMLFILEVGDDFFLGLKSKFYICKFKN